MLPEAEHNDDLYGYGKWLTVTQEQDAADVVAVLKDIGRVDRLVVDSYAIDCTWERMLRPFVGEIMVIDDLANREHDCDILLDQNFYLDMDSRYRELVPGHCRMLLGPRHALLREEFYQVRKTLRVRNGQLRKILVFYGGVDATDETGKAIRALISLEEVGKLDGVQVVVVVGAGNDRKEEIARVCHEVNFEYLCQVSNMAELMGEADLMLGAGGSTTWERCFLGLPAIVTAVAENQFKICEDCAKAGLIYYLGKWTEVAVQDMVHAIERMFIPDNLQSLSSSCRLEIGV